MSSNVDEGKLQAIAEAESWLKQARMYYQAWRYELGDDCSKRAKAALDSECFRRQPIPGYSRHEQPTTVKVVATHLPQGFMIIESAAFEPAIHELYKEPTSTGKRSKSG